MSTVVTVGRLLGGVALLFSNAFFVSIEFAMTRVRQFSKSEFDGSRGLQRAWEMTDKLEIYLSGCQVGITISSVGLGVVAEPAVAALFHEAGLLLGVSTAGDHTAASVIAALAAINILHVIVGEQIPTYFGVERTKTAAKWGAPVLYWWTKLMAPVIVLADRTAKFVLGLFGVAINRSWTEAEAEVEGEAAGGGQPSSRGELRRQMGESMSSMGMTTERREEVINALEIGQIPVSDVMVPREEIRPLYADDPFEENLERVRDSPHVRFPLVGDDLEDFRGVVYTPAIFDHLEELQSGERSLEDVAAPPMTVAADAPVSDVIDQFQAQNQELAFVLSGGETVGLVTTTDAFEAIAGDLEDPLDAETVD